MNMSTAGSEVNNNPVSDHEKFAVFCKDISTQLKHIINEAKNDYKEGREEFLSKKIGKLFKIVGCYKEGFQKLNIKTKSEFDEFAKQNFRYPMVRDAFEEITESEDEIRKAMTAILIVSFGDQNGAKNWLTETNCPYLMVTDSERKIYHSFGLYRSVYKVWCIKSLIYYVEQFLLGRQFPKPMANIVDDPQQMGGDFILDRSGQVILSYCSQVPTDRPTVDQILAALVKQ